MRIRCGLAIIVRDAGRWNNIVLSCQFRCPATGKSILKLICVLIVPFPILSVGVAVVVGGIDDLIVMPHLEVVAQFFNDDVRRLVHLFMVSIV